jgi:hypothetical protein
MPLWGNVDNAANSTIYAAAQAKLTPNTANRTAIFGNTTQEAFIANVAIGQFGVDTNEVTAAREEAAGDRAAHAGWVLRTVGSGGRAGRVQSEVLVAMGSLTGDAEDNVFEDFVLRIRTQPSNARANTTAGQTNTFTVAATSTPTGAALTYQWTFANGATITEGANVGVTTGTTLTVNSAVQTTNAAFKVAVSAAGADTVTSANATLTITV